MKMTFKEWGKAFFEAIMIMIGLYLLGVSLKIQAAVVLILIGITHFTRDCMKQAEKEAT